jgi:hypothetical protein
MTTNSDDHSAIERILAASDPQARAAYEQVLLATGDEGAAWKAYWEAEKAARIAAYGVHDCEEHLAWDEITAPCPACPDGLWRAWDAYCGLCGAGLQAAGHVHPLPDGDAWLARAGTRASELPR